MPTALTTVLTAVLTAVVAFVVMEPVTYATHRWVMHGLGEVLHRSHHRPLAERAGRWEANDAYPVMFAGVVVTAMAIGLNLPGLTPVVWVGIGVTAYGAVYALVHDVYIHRRLPLFRGREIGGLSHLAAAHRIHHLYGGEPYGMLVPIVPLPLRERAARTSRDPLAR